MHEKLVGHGQSVTFNPPPIVVVGHCCELLGAWVGGKMVGYGYRLIEPMIAEGEQCACSDDFIFEN